MANVHIGAEWEVCLQMGYMCEKDSIFFEMSIHHMLLNHHISDTKQRPSCSNCCFLKYKFRYIAFLHCVILQYVLVKARRIKITLEVLSYATMYQ